MVNDHDIHASYVYSATDDSAVLVRRRTAVCRGVRHAPVHRQVRRRAAVDNVDVPRAQLVVADGRVHDQDWQQGFVAHDRSRDCWSQRELHVHCAQFCWR